MNETEPVKPGWQTTEFWLMLVAQLAPLAVLFKIIPQDDIKTVQDTLSHAIQNVAALLASAAAIWKYIQSRGAVKAAAHVAKAADSNLLAAKISNKLPLAILLTFLFAGSASAADYNFILKGGKYYLINNDDPSQPNRPVTVQIVNLDGSSPPPVDPIPGPASGIEATANRLTKEAIQAGGTSTTAAAISSVYKIVADSVSEGKTSPENALPAVNFLLDGLLATQPDKDKWTAFRTSLGQRFDAVRQDGLLKTKEQYAKALGEVASGINSVIAFNGSLTNPQQVVSDKAAIFDKIDLAKLMEIIKFIMELWKLFAPM